MTGKVKLRVAIRTTERDQWVDTIWSTFYLLAGSLVPIWLGGYILLPVFNRTFNWTDYAQHGEFALYSAAIIAPALRVIAKDLDTFHFNNRQTFLFFGSILLAASVALYSGVISGFGIPQWEATFNKSRLLYLTVGLLVLSIIYSFFVMLLDHPIDPSTFKQTRDKQEERLDQEFSRALGGQNG